MPARFATYEEFWPHYLREHARPLTRGIHAAGTGLGLLILFWALVTGRPLLLPVALVVGYGFAWGSHMLVEQNRPATFSHPLWSLASDFRMAWLLLFVAGLLEVGWAVGLKLSEGFTRLWPSALTVVATAPIPVQTA